MRQSPFDPNILNEPVTKRDLANLCIVTQGAIAQINVVLRDLAAGKSVDRAYVEKIADQTDKLSQFFDELTGFNT